MSASRHIGHHGQLGELPINGVDIPTLDSLDGDLTSSGAFMLLIGFNQKSFANADTRLRIIIRVIFALTIHAGWFAGAPSLYPTPNCHAKKGYTKHRWGE